MSEPVFKEWLRARSWKGFDKLNELLVDAGGAIGMVPDAETKYGVELRCIARNMDYVYVKLLSCDGTADFGWGATIKRSALPKLLSQWGALSFKWTEPSGIHVQAFPFDRWRLPSQLGMPTRDVSWFMSMEQSPRKPATLTLVQRAGWATYFSRANPDRMLVSYLGVELMNLLPLLQVAKAESINLNPSVPVPFNQKLYDAALAVGHEYTMRKLVTEPPGFQYPFIPHAGILKLPPEQVAEFSL